MVDIETEVSLATIQLYFEKTEEARTAKLKALAQESFQILGKKQEQMNEYDKILYNKFKTELEK